MHEDEGLAEIREVLDERARLEEKYADDLDGGGPRQRRGQDSFSEQEWSAKKTRKKIADKSRARNR